MKRIGNPDTDCENIKSGYRDGVQHRKMCHTNNEKRETIHDGRNRTRKLRKNWNSRRKGNFKILGNIGSRHHKKN